MNSPEQQNSPRTALVLSGGGARAAYQVGVLKAVSQLLPRDAVSPFPIICGTSAGAINAAVLAIYAARFREGVKRLTLVWKMFRPGMVFRADARGIMKIGAHWFAAMLLGGLGRYNPTSLLDCTPLRHLLERYVPCDKIQESIDEGLVRALCVTASGYTSGQAVSFYQGTPDLRPWKRARRVGSAADIRIEHLMASAAIPFVFAAVKINREYFGDGSMGQMAPVSPALHLGADRVLAIGVRRPTGPDAPRLRAESYPSLAEVAGHVLNSIFLESLEADLERLQRINRTISLINPNELEHADLPLRPVAVLVISPSQDLGEIAQRYARYLPRPVRFLLRGIGVKNQSGTSLLSYLLFEKAYCRRLISLGYADTMQRKAEVLKFLDVGSLQ
ncbi:MAG: patatin-like phospholipase family protein [Acidiferrobacterales bacterium]